MEGEGALANVVFPITSVSIGGRAFYGTNVRYVSLPAHVTAVGTNAFVPGGNSRKVPERETGKGRTYAETNRDTA